MSTTQAAERWSPFGDTPLMPPDPNVGLTEAFHRDPRVHKVNLSVGTYATDEGQVPLLEAVRIAEERLSAQRRPRDYPPIAGPAQFTDAAQTLVFGADSGGWPGAVLTVQALGGTGALRLGADFLRRIHATTTVHLSTPTWANHESIFAAAGLSVAHYPYYSTALTGVDADSMLDHLGRVPAPNDVVVLHACCHNPTGSDMSASQWSDLAALLKRRRLIPFVDLAYLGFGDGPNADVQALRLLADAGLDFLVATSFSKSFSLYGERAGALSLVTSGPDESARVLSTLKRLARATYSYPPTHGAAIVSTVLSDPALRDLWLGELEAMRCRIAAMRRALVESLGALQCQLPLPALAAQRGMFSYTGLAGDQVEALRERHGIYALESGRICIGALTPSNVRHVAQAIANCARPVPAQVPAIALNAFQE